jgi:hypothetical protein
MRLSRRTMLSVWLIPAIISMSAVLHAAEATVIIARDCDYVLLDSSEGQILIKVIKGEHPKAGDKLSGKLERGFSELINKRTNEAMQAWVDQVDPSGTKALMRYSQYCN